ncbi:glycoside hydrolase family 88 protein [Candidatus Binatus sp.]|uniref:glycoside hydrolase family 88 protein n=1 Tax=Candidatus Binatus sp. TaxID=2811406 RepID=UPI003C80A42C
MHSAEINVEEVRGALERLTSNASRELFVKQPHWGDAILCGGLLAAAGALKTNAPVEAAHRWFDPKLEAGPRTGGWFWFWTAEAAPALSFYIRTKRPEYLEYARKVIETLETTAVRTPDGAIVPHPPALEVWVDVSYFTAPKMATYGDVVGDRSKIEWAADQILLHAKYLTDPASGLLWHVAYVEKNAHSPCLWARGNSWFSMACAMVLAILDQQDRGPGFRGPDPAESLRTKLDAIESAVVRQLNAVIKLQDESGLWHTVIDRPDSYLEASSAAGFASALGWAIFFRYRGLDLARARTAYVRAINAICSKINANGEFTCVSRQTPPGDFDFYNSIEVGTAPYATGICLGALSNALLRSRDPARKDETNRVWLTKPKQS